MSVRYTDSLADVAPEHLAGFFEGWPDPPSPATHLALLRGSAHVVLAVDDVSGRVVGFVNALSDGVLSAYVPLLEVLPEWRGRGIGRALVERVLAACDGLYMTDLTCDAGLVPFYEALGLVRGTAMLRRRYDRQSGAR